jgi:hypothetical protein
MTENQGSEVAMTRLHCCEQMTYHANYHCSLHQHPFDCPDKLVSYTPKYDEYGLIVHDGGSSSIMIRYCPWCGIKLPPSRRDQWFDTLEALGFEDPWSQDIPQEFLTDAWYKTRKADS